MKRIMDETVQASRKVSSQTSRVYSFSSSSNMFIHLCRFSLCLICF